MRRFNFKAKAKARAVVFVLFFLVMSISYQNCAPKNFSKNSVASTNTVNSVGTGTTTTSTTIPGSTTTTMPTTATTGPTTPTTVRTTPTTGPTTTTTQNNGCPSGMIPTGSDAQAVAVPTTFVMPPIIKIAVPTEFITDNPSCLGRTDILQDTTAPGTDSISPLDYRTVGFHSYESIYSVYRISQSQATTDFATMYDANLLFAANVGTLGYFVQNKGNICIGAHKLGEPAPNGELINSESISTEGPRGVLTLINRSGVEQSAFSFSSNYRARNYLAGYSLSNFQANCFDKTIIVNGNIDHVQSGGSCGYASSQGLLELKNGSISYVNSLTGILKVANGNLGNISVTGDVYMTNGNIDTVNYGLGNMYLDRADVKTMGRFQGNLYVNNSVVHAFPFNGGGKVYLSNGGRIPACIPSTWTVIRQ